MNWVFIPPDRLPEAPSPLTCPVVVELINTGSELLLGRILNTHQQWLGRKLADLGYPVDRQCTVPDTAGGIEAAVRESLARADLVLTTGGLGPTCDDLTRERIATLLGRTLHHDPEVEGQIRHYFESRGRPVPQRSHVEALVPQGALVLPNRAGTAPGLAFKVDPNPFRPGDKASWLIVLPGPPRELYPMFTEQVVPLLQQELPLEGKFLSLTLKTTGVGESQLEEWLAPAMEPLAQRGLEIGYCARVGEVDVRFAGRGPHVSGLLAEAEAIARPLIGEFIFGREDETLESSLVHRLTELGCTLALAESCTGGHIANRITNVPGASAVLKAGFVTYANDAKTQSLGVEPALIAEHGAVSEPVARQMAEGARRTAGADYALSVTGIAGPGGGSEAKPVGTVFLGLAGPNGTRVVRQLNRFDRETFKFVTAQQAMDLLRRQLNQPATS